MSLVERALKKLQESRTTASTDPSDAAAPTHAKPSIVSDIDTASGAVPLSIPRVPTSALATGRPIAIDRDALRAAGLLSPENQERTIADQYRLIKRPLIAKAIGRGVPRLERGQIIMVASALPGEGKTFTSVNLALSLAREHEISVVLVDSDVPKPHISRVLGLDKDRGLLDALGKDAPGIESLIRPTDVPGLSVLPAGQPADNAPELLASTQMEQMMHRIAAADPQRLVLIDSPPLLLTNESRVLVGVAGQVVLVVRAGVTSHQAVLDAISYLDGHKGVGLVLNQCDAAVTEGYYYGQVPYGPGGTEGE